MPLYFCVPAAVQVLTGASCTAPRTVQSLANCAGSTLRAPNIPPRSLAALPRSPSLSRDSPGRAAAIGSAADRSPLAKAPSNLSARLFGDGGGGNGAESAAQVEEARREAAAIARLRRRLREVSSALSGDDDGGWVIGTRGAALQLLARKFAESVPDQVTSTGCSDCMRPSGPDVGLCPYSNICSIALPGCSTLPEALKHGLWPRLRCTGSQLCRVVGKCQSQQATACVQAVSVAQLQGHLMLHRHDPINAVLSADFQSR